MLKNQVSFVFKKSFLLTKYSPIKVSSLLNILLINIARKSIHFLCPSDHIQSLFPKSEFECLHHLRVYNFANACQKDQLVEPVNRLNRKL